KAGAEALNPRNNLADARDTHKIRKQKQAQQSEDDSKWCELPAPTSLLTQNIARFCRWHRITVPHGFDPRATRVPLNILSECLLCASVALVYDATFHF